MLLYNVAWKLQITSDRDERKRHRGRGDEWSLHKNGNCNMRCIDHMPHCHRPVAPFQWTRNVINHRCKQFILISNRFQMMKIENYEVVLSVCHETIRPNIIRLAHVEWASHFFSFNTNRIRIEKLAICSMIVEDDNFFQVDARGFRASCSWLSSRRFKSMKNKVDIFHETKTFK